MRHPCCSLSCSQQATKRCSGARCRCLCQGSPLQVTWMLARDAVAHGWHHYCHSPQSPECISSLQNMVMVSFPSVAPCSSSPNFPSAFKKMLLITYFNTLHQSNVLFFHYSFSDLFFFLRYLAKGLSVLLIFKTPNPTFTDFLLFHSLLY